jgi:creatinine amidohydrolase
MSADLIPLLSRSNRQARALTQSGAPVYLSVNPIEYHGPHLSLENDGLISRWLVHDIHRLLRERHAEWPLLWAGELRIGVDPVPGPGSQPVAMAEVRRVVRRACRSLLDLGARRLVVMSFHGSPLHNMALWDGVLTARRAGVPAVALMNAFMREVPRVDGRELAPAFAHIEPVTAQEMMRDLRLDFHAGFGETSLALHYAPETVSPHLSQVPPCPKPEPVVWARHAAQLAELAGRHALAVDLASVGRILAWYRMRPFFGYTSSPHLATASSGAVFADYIAPRLAGWAERVLVGGEPPPAPVMRWLEPLTLGGRLLSTRRMVDQ